MSLLGLQLYDIRKGGFPTHKSKKDGSIDLIGVSRRTPSNVVRKKQRREKTARDHLMTNARVQQSNELWPTCCKNGWILSLAWSQQQGYRQKNTANPVQTIMGRTVEARNKNGTAKGRL